MKAIGLGYTKISQNLHLVSCVLDTEEKIATFKIHCPNTLYYKMDRSFEIIQEIAQKIMTIESPVIVMDEKLGNCYRTDAKHINGGISTLVRLLSKDEDYLGAKGKGKILVEVPTKKLYRFLSARVRVSIKDCITLAKQEFGVTTNEHTIGAFISSLFSLMIMVGGNTPMRRVMALDMINRVYHGTNRCKKADVKPNFASKFLQEINYKSKIKGV